MKEKGGYIKELKNKMSNDSWANLGTGMGKLGGDKLESTKFENNTIIQRQELTNIYRSGGVGKRVVTLPVNDMVRNWFKVTDDTDALIVDWMDKNLKIRNVFSDQLTWARLYGGAIGIMILDDGRELDEELIETNIKDFESITVYDRHRVTWDTGDLYNNSSHPKFGTPYQYRVTPLFGVSFYVHETRVLRLDGETLPDEELNNNNGWHDSVLQSPYTAIRDLGGSMNAAAHIIDEFIMSVLTVDNLMNLVEQGEENAILKRLSLVDMTKRTSNTTLIDIDEKYDKISSNASGLDQLLDKLIQNLSGSTGIPASLLMGQTPKGLNASGALESDIKYYYADIALKQKLEMMPYFERVIYLTMLNKTGPTNGKILNASIEFEPLWQPTQKEIIETRDIQSQIDERYILLGGLKVGGVMDSRYGGDTYSFDTNPDAIIKDDRGLTDKELDEDNDK